MITTNLLAKKLGRKSFEFREIDSEYAIANRIHKKPEWKKVVYPDGFDAATQKGIKPYYDSVNDVVSFQIVSMTQQEQDEYVEKQFENELTSEVDSTLTEAQNIVKTIFKDLARYRKQGNIGQYPFGQTQYLNTIDILYDALKPMYDGLPVLTQKRINDIVEPPVQPYKLIYLEVKSRIDTYLQ